MLARYLQLITFLSKLKQTFPKLINFLFEKIFITRIKIKFINLADAISPLHKTFKKEIIWVEDITANYFDYWK